MLLVGAVLCGTTAPAQVQRYDMGRATSPTVPGWTSVTPATTWSSGSGFGWLSGGPGLAISGFERSSVSQYVVHNLHPDLIRDGNAFIAGPRTFRVAVAAGPRMCVVHVGDLGEPHLPTPVLTPLDDITIKADGIVVASDVFARTVNKKASFDGAYGGFKRVAFIADPGSDGLLDLTFTGAGRVAILGVEIYGYARPPIWFDHATNGLATTAPAGSALHGAVVHLNNHDYAAARTAIDAITGDDLGKAWAYAWWTGWLTGSEQDVDTTLLRDPNVPGAPGVIENLLSSQNQDNAAVAFLLAETRDFARGQLFLESRGYTKQLFPENPGSIVLSHLPDVNDIVANSCAGVQLLEQMHADILDPAPDATQTQSPYFAKAQYLIARNMFGRNTHVFPSVDYDRYFLGIYHELWGRLDPAAGPQRIYPKAIDVGVQAWLFENYIDWNQPGGLLLPWDGTAPPFSPSEFANAWWAPQVMFLGQPAPTWADRQWRYGRMLRELVRWWSDNRARSGDWGGGGGDDVEGVGALSVQTITMQEGAGNLVEQAARTALTRVLYGPEVDQDQGYWYVSPPGYIDPEHGGEYTSIPLLLLTPPNYGDPTFVEFAMRTVRNIDEPVDPSTSWTGTGGAIPWRHFKSFLFGAHGYALGGPGNVDMDITENMKALLPIFALFEYTSMPKVKDLLYEYSRAWAYEALRQDDASKPLGVLPVGVDYATGVMGEGPGQWFVNNQGNGGEVGLYNLEIYLAMLASYRVATVPPQDKLELLRPIARVIEFVNSTTPDELGAPGSAGWTAFKVLGAAVKIAVAAKGELIAEQLALGFDPGQIDTLITNHGDPYSKYLNAQTPPTGKDKSGLTARWDRDAQWLTWFWPFATNVVTYTDRIGFGNGDGMRSLHEARGGQPYQGSLSHVFNWFDKTPVVSGPNGELEFAVLVNDLDLAAVPNTTVARVLLCNLGATARVIGMRGWKLPLGTYDVFGGPDGNGDDRMDSVAWTITNQLLDQRGVPLDSGLVGPGQVHVVEFRLVSPTLVPTLRPDPAISADDVRFGPNGQVAVTVHNLGALSTPSGIAVELRTPAGVLLQTIANVPVINAAVDLTPQSTVAVFSYLAAVGETVVVKLVLPGGTQQITSFNDEASATR